MTVKDRTCFDCRVAEIDPGCPGCHTLPNGDPGWPDDPAVAMCMDPLASELEQEFMDIVYETNQAISAAVWKNTKELRNCKPEEAMKLTYRMKQSIAYNLQYHGDFAPFCPMFQQRTRKCACCKKEYPANEGEFYCRKCEDGIREWEKQHEEELSKNIWYPPRSQEDEDLLFKEYEECCAKDLVDDIGMVGD